MRPWVVGLLALCLVATFGAEIGTGQQTVPFTNGIPLAPLGLSGRKLPDKPPEFDTAEGQNIRVVVVTRALEYPWALAFLPDGTMLVTERAGRLRVIRNGVLDPQPVAGSPASYWAGESGLPGAVHGYMDVALHPQFAENQLVYLTYTKPLDEKRTDGGHRARTLRRSSADRGQGHLGWRTRPARPRIAFGRDGTLYITTTANFGSRTTRRTRTRRAARCCGSTTTVVFRATTRSSGAPATSRRCIRSATAARSGLPCIRAPARCG